ncbi:MAG: tRNA preQ1(34) S-adenosylmethionine ribosyltransferase-isomerase QueA [Candidatus Lambdaproteobacteria bacterium]|nr:tRNA preQ1(34) S-adenosylmethionine ribosyltransferase-isomerase QueA [Candidatus Lambdaproteobacteria bacterium]
MAALLDAYDYDLPPEQIARYPLPERDRARLMVLARGQHGTAHHVFRELPELLPARSLLVFNDTKVLPARLEGRLPQGTAIEALLVEEVGAGVWWAMVKGARRVRPDMRLALGDGHLPARAIERDAEGRWLVAFDDPATFRERLERHGLAPLPPYLRRRGERRDPASDRAAYQTCYARNEGAVAAPTAGLHFTPQLIRALRARGCALEEITLHAGPGTFLPIQQPDPAHHRMHREHYAIAPAVAARLLEHRRAGRPLIAIGTTTVRALESWAALGFPLGQQGWTELFIRPPFPFRAVDGLITNFHQPRSTLLMLVAALHGRERLMAAYREARGCGYRFFSFGDCMAILPAPEGLPPSGRLRALRQAAPPVAPHGPVQP